MFQNSEVPLKIFFFQNPPHILQTDSNNYLTGNQFYIIINDTFKHVFKATYRSMSPNQFVVNNLDKQVLLIISFITVTPVGPSFAPQIQVWNHIDQL